MKLLRRHEDTVVDCHTDHRDHVRHEVTEQPVSAGTCEQSWTFAPGQLVSLVAGVGVIAVGIIPLIRADVDGSLSTPVGQVLGYTHTAWLGIAEVGLGLLLVLVGTGGWGRAVSAVLGAATAIAGGLILAEPGQMPDELGIEKDFGWPLIGLGAIVALAQHSVEVEVGRGRIVDLRGVAHVREGAYRVLVHLRPARGRRRLVDEPEEHGRRVDEVAHQVPHGPALTGGGRVPTIVTHGGDAAGHDGLLLAASLRNGHARTVPSPPGDGLEPAATDLPSEP